MSRPSIQSKLAATKPAAAKPAAKGALRPRGTANKAAGEPSKPWTFLTNHAHVLIVLYEDPDLVLRKVAMRVGITERAVQRIIQDLEEEGFLIRKKIGRRNHYQVRLKKALRHPIESHRKIGDLMNLITS